MLVEIDREAACWTLTLNRPEKANALSAELVEMLAAAVDEANRAGVPLIVFRGNGKNFSAGFDFGELEQQSEADLLHRFVRIEMLLQSVARSSAVTVALAHGRNFGAGVDLIAACRWRVAAPDATFRMPGLAFGLVLGTRRFADIVGRDKARDILDGLETFDAARAESLGFLRVIAPSDQWPQVISEAKAVAARLAPENRELLYGALDDSRNDADLASLVRSAAKPGIKERIRAYLQRPRESA
jgi:enoyl-CoA hydratase